jgi:CRISPR-associated protein Csb3
MREVSIPVDLLNPGQVFACLGFAEAAEVLLGDAAGAFDWSQPGQARFWLRARGTGSPVQAVLDFLDRAQARAAAPDGSPCVGSWNKSWGDSPSTLDRARGYAIPDPPSPATLVCVLTDGERSLQLDHWGDGTERDNVKFWAGAGGYPGAGLARDALKLVRGRAAAASEAPFALSAPQSSSFRLDWRRDYIPIDAGFSLNKHSTIETLGYPLVELLGALGLSHARPRRAERTSKLQYAYAVIGRAKADETLWLPLTLLRAALGGARLPFATRNFRMFLDWPGKKDQARSITTVTEETTE